MLNNRLLEGSTEEAGQRVILFAGDDEDDALLVRQALEKSRLINSLYVVRTGESALAYLNGEGSFSDHAQHPVPELFLLDLKLPGLDALTVLRKLRQQLHLNRMRVVVLASWDQTAQINQALQAGANSFLFKPVRTERFIDTMMTMKGGWVWVNSPHLMCQPTPTNPVNLSAG
jgi:CheY-like chemotaxis protein